MGEVRPQEYFDSIFNFAAIPSEQVWKDFIASVRYKGVKIAAADIEGYDQLIRAELGVYDSALEPDDYAGFDENKPAKFLVNETTGFTASAAWGSVSVTAQELEDNKVTLFYTPGHGWNVILDKRPADGAPGAPGGAIAADWTAGTYTKGTLVTHNGKTYVANVATSQEPGTGSDWRLDGGIEGIDGIKQINIASYNNQYYYGSSGTTTTSNLNSRATDKIRVYPGDIVQTTGRTTTPSTPGIVVFDKDTGERIAQVNYPNATSAHTLTFKVEVECDIVCQYRVNADATGGVPNPVETTISYWIQHGIAMIRPLNSAFLLKEGSELESKIERIIERISKVVSNIDLLPASSNFVAKKNPSKGIDYAVEPEAVSFKLASFFSSVNLDAGKYSLQAMVKATNNTGAIIDTIVPGVQTFQIPSGMLREEGVGNSNLFLLNEDDYCHPSVAYDSIGVAGYKYWMLTSILPQLSLDEGVTHEDEEVFVTNTPEDATSWKRVRSLYEDNSDTSLTLRLPPVPAAWSNTTRRNGFLPCPKQGNTIEVSNPAHNGGPSRDAVMVTLGGSLPWKHDPCCFFHDGYWYSIHTFQLFFTGITQQQKFLVMVRTNDGINWESVRADGTTWPLDSDANVALLFSKDPVSGKYNYWKYLHSTGWMNPEMIKFGNSEWSLFYGSNFSLKFTGAEPWSVDWDNPAPVSGTGSAGNHPGLFYDSATSKLYCLQTSGSDQEPSLWVSTDKGSSFTKLPYNPLYSTSVNLYYKYAACIGEGGKVITFLTLRNFTNDPRNTLLNAVRRGVRYHKLITQVFPSVADIESKATTGLDGGYCDFIIDVYNSAAPVRRKTYYFAGVAQRTSFAAHNNPAINLKVGDIDVQEGDSVQVTVQSIGRNGGTCYVGALNFVKQ